MCQKIIAKTIITEKTVASFNVKNIKNNLVKNNDKIKLNAFLSFYRFIVFFITRFVLNCFFFQFSKLKLFYSRKHNMLFVHFNECLPFMISPPVCRPNERITFVQYKLLSAIRKADENCLKHN